MFDVKIRYTYTRQISPYEQNHETGIDSDAAESIGKWMSQRFLARFPYAMQGSTVESTRFKYPQAGEQLEMHQASVNNWVKRFVSEDLKGLETRPGKGANRLSGHRTRKSSGRP